MPLPYNREMIPQARALRKNMTPQERKLWYLFLSKYPIRFQRQKTISCFIVDFYCAKANLAIEIDGIQHHSKQGESYDAERSMILRQYDVKVIRFDNDAIDNNFDFVCRVIEEKIGQLVREQR